MQHDNNISVIILAGGNSRRMTSDKRLLKLNDKTIIELTIELAKSISSDVLISANDDLPVFKNYKTVKDMYLGLGPIVGLLSGMLEIKHNSALLLSCDMPLITKKEINLLIEKNQPDKIIVGILNGNIQPMPGIFPKSLLPEYSKNIMSNDKSLTNLIRTNSHVYVHLKDNLKDKFINLNYPEDYAKLIDRYKISKC